MSNADTISALGEVRSVFSGDEGLEGATLAAFDREDETATVTPASLSALSTDLDVAMRPRI